MTYAFRLFEKGFDKNTWILYCVTNQQLDALSVEFQVKDIVRIVNIERATVQYWLREGIIHAELSGETTQGVARRFSFANLLAVTMSSCTGFPSRIP